MADERGKELKMKHIKRDARERRALRRTFIEMAIAIVVFVSPFMLAGLVIAKLTGTSWKDILVGISFWLGIVLIFVRSALRTYYKGELFAPEMYEEDDLPAPSTPRQKNT